MAALTPVVDSLDAVPEPARQFYVAKDGKYHVELSAPPAGFVPAADLATANTRIVEFRDNNIRLTQEVETLRPLKTQFEGIDPAAARTAITEVAALKAKGVTKADDVATLVNSAVQAALKPVTEQLAASTAATAAERKRADEQTLRSHISEKFLKAGGRANAVDYIIEKAKSEFVVEGGNVKAAPNKFSATHPGNPLEVDEWLVSAAKTHDFAFAPSTGSGANPAKGSNAGLKPGQTVLLDPTPQQLGDAATAKGIQAGTIKVQYSNK